MQSCSKIMESKTIQCVGNNRLKNDQKKMWKTFLGKLLKWKFAFIMNVLFKCSSYLVDKILRF